jgi:replication initiation and membrane attachment protein DnaB
VQYHRLKVHLENDFKSVVSQVNDVNDLNLQVNNVQDNNIKSIDNNLNMLKTQLGTVKNTISVANSQLLVKKNADSSIMVCNPDNTGCRTLMS